MTARKRRIDLWLVERGFADTRHRAQALLLAGKVLVNQQKVEKPGQLVDPEAEIRVLEELRFASRGGLKLQAALDHFRIQVSGRVCADLGASTGGFTDCLLQNGARAVHAYDVGKGQMAWKLRQDPRVWIHDEFNVRDITFEDLPEQVSLATVDLSFISLTKVLLPLTTAMRLRFELWQDRPEALRQELLLLVKPQFEVGKGEVGKGGIVRDPAKRQKVLRSIEDFAMRTGLEAMGSMPAPIPGWKGNQEFLLYLRIPPVL
mgnify:CR=1 FL=1